MDTETTVVIRIIFISDTIVNYELESIADVKWTEYTEISEFKMRKKLETRQICWLKIVLKFAVIYRMTPVFRTK